MTLAMPGRPSAKVKAELTEVVAQQRLVWHGNVGADWLFAGDRQFIIDPGDGDTVNFTHVEDVHGLLFPLFRALMGSAIQRHHDGPEHRAGSACRGAGGGSSLVSVTAAPARTPGRPRMSMPVLGGGGHQRVRHECSIEAKQQSRSADDRRVACPPRVHGRRRAGGRGRGLAGFAPPLLDLS